MDLLQQLEIIDSSITRMEQIFRLNSVIERISPPKSRHEALTLRALEVIRDGLPEAPELTVEHLAHTSNPTLCRHVGLQASSTMR
jgi:hypothetical protein